MHELIKNKEYEKILNKCYPLIISRSHYYNSRSKFNHIDDLIQECNIAVMIAVDNFDIKRSKNFFQLVRWYIDSRACKYLNKMYPGVRKPAQADYINVQSVEFLTENNNDSFMNKLVVELPDVCYDDEIKYLRTLLIKLNDNEKLLLTLRFGLDNDTPQTLKSIANIFGVTKMTITWRIKKILKQLKKQL